MQSLHTQRAAAGWMACWGVRGGPSAKCCSFNSPKRWPWKLPFMGCDEVWIQSPSSLGSCHFLCCDCQLCQTISTGPVEGRWDWQGPLGKVDIKRPCKLISVLGLSCSFLFFILLNAIKAAKIGTGSVTSPMQLNCTLSDCRAKGVLIWVRLWKILCSSSFHLKFLGSRPKLTHCRLILYTRERSMHSTIFSCAQRIKCRLFNFIKSLTTGADTEGGKYAGPETSQNPPASISIKARCSTGCSNLIKPTNDKGFSLRLAGPRVHSSVVIPGVVPQANR